MPAETEVAYVLPAFIQPGTNYYLSIHTGQTEFMLWLDLEVPKAP
jgi:hypothetical protein